MMKCRHETPCSKRCLLGTGEFKPCRGYDKCKYFQPNYTTNGDLIRAMSDEELAKHNVRNIKVWNRYEGHYDYKFMCSDGYITEEYEWALEHELDWLRQPVKEGDGDD